jgi:dTDP-4-amino-4,6-dideoxygalactose transaminase
VFEIAQANPKASYFAHREEIDTAIARVLESGRYILGNEVAAFEAEFARYLGVREGIGVASGTDALMLALRVCGVGPGDTVITVSHTAVATVAAIELVGAKPILIDVDSQTYTMDPNRLEDLLTHPGVHRSVARPRAVIPVHLYGHPADMEAIIEVAERSGLIVIEDCAQAHGAAIRARKTGAWGNVAAFSFYPTKNLGGLGDGGALVTDSPHLAARARSMREYGWRERYASEVPGMNTRLDELQATVLRVKLRHLDADNARRQHLARTYDALLAGTDLLSPRTRPDCVHVYHQYVVCSIQRDALRAELRRRGIASAIHYPVPVHNQPAYAGRVPTARSLDVTEKIAREVLSLPMYPELSDDDLGTVGEHILAAQRTLASRC